MRSCEMHELLPIEKHDPFYSLLVACLDGSKFLLPLRMALCNESLVFRLLCLLGIETTVLEGAEVTAALETNGGDETLNLGATRIGRQYPAPFQIKLDLNSRLGVWLCSLLLLAGHLATDDKLPDIVLLLQVEELANLGSPLGTETLGEDIFRQAGDALFALLDDDERENGNVWTDNASSDRLPLALTSAACAVARVAIGEEEAYTER